MAHLGLIVGDAALPTTGDTALNTILSDEHFVTMHSDIDPEPIGKDGIVLAESCSTADLNGKYLDLAIPILALDVGYWDSLGMTDAPNSNSGTTEIVLEHEITLGIEAPLRTAGGFFGPSDANVISSAQIFLRNTALTNVLGWAIEEGDILFTGNALKRMVALSITNTIAANLTADGNKIILNAVDWMLTPDINSKNSLVISSVPNTPHLAYFRRKIG